MTEPHDVLEALLFASDTPVEPGLIQDVLDLPSAEAARELVEALRRRLDEQGRALQIIEAGGGFRMVTRPEVAPWLVKLARSKTKSRLSRPALETLAIIAYRQPVSRPEVDATRGVNSEGVLDSLLERRLVRIAGRKDSPGRPFLYETTREFLVAFGLRDLGDLPKVDGELVVMDPAAIAPASDQSQAADAAVDAETPDTEPIADTGYAAQVEEAGDLEPGTDDVLPPDAELLPDAVLPPDIELPPGAALPRDTALLPDPVLPPDVELPPDAALADSGLAVDARVAVDIESGVDTDLAPDIEPADAELAVGRALDASAAIDTNLADETGAVVDPELPDKTGPAIDAVHGAPAAKAEPRDEASRATVREAAAGGAGPSGEAEQPARAPRLPGAHASASARSAGDAGAPGASAAPPPDEHTQRTRHAGGRSGEAPGEDSAQQDPGAGRTDVAPRG